MIKTLNAERRTLNGVGIERVIARRLAYRPLPWAKLQSSRKTKKRRVTALAARRFWFKIAGMKLRALLVKSLFLSVSLGVAGPLLAQNMPTPSQPSSDTAKTPADAPATIPGLVISRPNGGFLGLEIDSSTNTFKLSFYDAKKKPIVADAGSAIIRWLYRDTGSEKFIYQLTPDSDGKALVSPRGVVPPLPHLAVLLLFPDTSSSDPIEPAYQPVDLTSLAPSS